MPVTLIIPARYWDDFCDRMPVDEPSQMPVEVRRTGNRVTIEVTQIQMAYLSGDATFYAEGNTDDTPPAVLRGAQRVAALCAEQNNRPASAVDVREPALAAWPTYARQH